MLRELNFRYLTELDIADGLDLLKGLLGRPMLVMPHVSVRLADGSMLAKRLQHIHKTLAAAREYDVRTLFVSGGVAANRELRIAFEREAGMQGLPVFFPSRALSTDNAAMIAAAAFPKFLRGEFVAMDFSAEAGMALR